MSRLLRHPLAWVAWLAAAATATLTTRNPLYLIVVLLLILLVYQTAAEGAATEPAWGAFIRLGIVFGLITVGFDVLTAHVGDTVLWAFPADWPIIGGRITLEVVVHGLIGVLQLACLLLSSAAFSLSLDTAALLRYIPAAFHQVGVVLTIGLAFVPQTVAGFSEIRDAQRVRGHRFRAARDLLPLFGPLLTTGLERAIQLAESLEARGFGYTDSAPRREWPALLALLLSSLALTAALFSLGYWGRQPWMIALGVTGAVLLIGTLRYLTPRQRRTHYRRAAWHRPDIILAASSLAVLIGLVAVALSQRTTLFYSPYPRLGWPPFEGWIVLLYLPLAAPVLRARRGRPRALDGVPGD